MLKQLPGMTGVAAVVYALLNLWFGNAEYAAVGPAELPTGQLEAILPMLAAVLYPLVTKKWPIVKMILDLFKYQPPKIPDLLGLITRFEQHAVDTDDDELLALCADQRAVLLSQQRKQKDKPAPEGPKETQ